MMRKVIAIAIAVFLLLAFLWLSWVEGIYDNAVLEDGAASGCIETNKLEVQNTNKFTQLFKWDLVLSSQA